MQYFGGKSKIAKEIVNILNSYRKPNQLYVEPFVGGGSIMSKMDGERIACDKHPYLIKMYKELQNGWIPPDDVNEEYYHMAKNKEVQECEIGFIGFACSFSGKWFSGYARDKTQGKNYAKLSKNSLMRKMENMKDVWFLESDYKILTFKDALIYCDPPYKGTTQYGLVGDFDSVEFWNIMREWSKKNTVIISEYTAPNDFKCIWERKTKLIIRNSNNQNKDTIERLFMYNGL